jgi:hypothetical protein
MIVYSPSTYQDYKSNNKHFHKDLSTVQYFPEMITGQGNPALPCTLLCPVAGAGWQNLFLPCPAK